MVQVSVGKLLYSVPHVSSGQQTNAFLGKKVSRICESAVDIVVKYLNDLVQCSLPQFFHAIVLFMLSFLNAACLHLILKLLFQVPYLQIRENNWTFNADYKGRWNVRYDLWDEHKASTSSVRHFSVDVFWLCFPSQHLAPIKKKAHS